MPYKPRPLGSIIRAAVVYNKESDLGIFIYHQFSICYATDSDRTTSDDDDGDDDVSSCQD